MDSTNNWLGFNGAVVADLHPPPQHGMEEAEQPKLENFLLVQEPTTTAPAPSGRPFGPGGASTIGLSMIKNWLRSQPAPAGAPPDRNMALVPALLPEGNGTVASAAVVSGGAVMEAAQQKTKPLVETFGQRTSVYRGVTKHRWTGRYEAHLWDNSCRREGQTRKGRQVYLGGYDKEEKAGRAYDLAALKYWGTATTTNFPVSEYEKELEEMKHMSRQEYVASLRRKSSGFSRGASMYRGVTRHHQHGRWQARIGRVTGNKDLYLGTFSTQEEAAEAYDIAAIKFRGLNAVTNFDMSRYDVKSIIESHIPIGASGTKRTKSVNVSDNSDMGFHYNGNDAGHLVTSNLLTDGIGSYGPQHGAYSGWAPITFLPPAELQCRNGHGYSRMWSKQEEQDGAVVAAAHSLHNLQHFPTVDSTNNFFHNPSAVQEVMGLEDMHRQLLDSNSDVYNGGIGYHGASSDSGYAMPFAKLVGHGHGNLAASSSEDDGGTVSGLYNGQNFYLSQDSPLGDARKNNTYGQGQGVENENWPPGSSAAEMSRKADDMMVCPGLPLYHGNGTY